MNLTSSDGCVIINGIQGEINLLNSVENIDFAKEIAVLWGSNQCDINESNIDYLDDNNEVIDLTNDPIRRIIEINY